MRTLLKESLTKEKFEEAQKIIDANYADGWGRSLSDGRMFICPCWTLLNEETEKAIRMIAKKPKTYLEHNFSIPGGCEVDSYKECLECQQRADCNNCPCNDCSDYESGKCGECEEVFSCEDCESCQGTIYIDTTPIITEGRIIFEDGFREQFIEYRKESMKQSRKRDEERIRELKKEIEKDEKNDNKFIVYIESVS